MPMVKAQAPGPVCPIVSPLESVVARLSALARQLGDQAADGGTQMNEKAPCFEAGALARPFG
jgi:hypothetical protein